MNAAWKAVLELDEDRRVVSGSDTALCAAVARGADIRIQTEFRHREHIDPTSDCNELIREVAEFRCTYLMENRWTAGIMTLRQPIAVPEGFGPRPSMSFFLYNQDGQQAIARPFLDCLPSAAEPGPSPVDPHPDMPRYHEQDHWDAGTNAPSSNFVYGFDFLRYYVRDDWQEVLSHAGDGRVVSGSIDTLAEAFSQGLEVKAAVRGLCSDLGEEPAGAMAHETFVQMGSCYHYTQRKLFLAGSHPVVRVRPSIPLAYTSRGWDFGWLMLRSDGLVARLLYDPYTLRHRRSQGQYAIRWFVR